MSIAGAIAVTRPQTIATGTVISPACKRTAEMANSADDAVKSATPRVRADIRSASEPAHAESNRGGRPMTMPRIAVAGFHSVSSPTSQTNTNRLVPSAIEAMMLLARTPRNAAFAITLPTLFFGVVADVMRS